MLGEIVVVRGDEGIGGVKNGGQFSGWTEGRVIHQDEYAATSLEWLCVTIGGEAGGKQGEKQEDLN